MPKNLIEAALFMSSDVLSVEQISRITGLKAKEVEERLAELEKEYAERGVEIVQGPEGWGMRVKPDILPKVAHLTPYSDLRGGHRRTLALVAYKEPVTQSEVVRIQGNKAYGYIKKLVKKGLIKTEKQGRTKILMLTKEFERYFGEEKERIKEMLQQGMEKTGEKKEKAEEPGEDGEKTYSDIAEVIPFDTN